MKNTTILLSLLFFLCINLNTLKANNLNKEEKKDLIQKMSKSENVISYVENSFQIGILLVVSKLDSNNKYQQGFEKIKINNIIEKQIESHNKYYVKILEEFKEFKEINSVEKKQIMKSVIPNVQQNIFTCIWEKLSLLAAFLELTDSEFTLFSTCTGSLVMADIMAIVATEGFFIAATLPSLTAEITTCVELAASELTAEEVGLWVSDTLTRIALCL